MSFVRRRYYFWLVRAYFKRWSKTIISSLVFGVIAFFAFAFILNFYILPIFQKKVQSIGYIGSFTTTNIPEQVLKDVSYGLTKVGPDGSISPAAAYHWDIKNGGKTYVFYIKRGQFFNGGKELNSETLPINFKDVKKRPISEYKVELDLKEPYAPFLSAISRPIIAKNFAGLGEYKVTKVDINGGFVRSMVLQNKKNGEYKKIVNFYPTEDALRTAYALGEVDQIYGLPNYNVKGSDMSKWVNTHVDKVTDYGELLTMFYNTTDSTLSDKKVRGALTYAIPPVFDEGERAFSPIPPNSLYFSKGPNYGISDNSIAQSLIDGNPDVSTKVFEITTLEEYKDVAEKISKAWAKIGVKSKVKVVTTLPDNFQILLYPMKLPEDPDQYTLWHTGQVNNISKFKDLRIDKLLEDGRSTSNVENRISIYSDFQKYIIDDAPASFIYFPYKYNLSRN